MSDDHQTDRTGLFTTIFIALVVLTGLSFLVANSSLMEQPLRGWAAMMIISIAKAMLVILFFMHLKWESNWKFVLTIPAAVMSALLILILIPDIGNRTQHYSAEREKFAPAVAEDHAAGDHAAGDHAAEHADRKAVGPVNKTKN